MDKEILKIIAKVYEVEAESILGDSRKKPLPEARRMYCYMRKRPQTKLRIIAEKLNQNRSSVHQNIDTIKDEINLYNGVRYKFKLVKAMLLEYLNNTKNQLENWLKNNPYQDQIVREQKLERLADVKETYEYIINL